MTTFLLALVIAGITTVALRRDIGPTPTTPKAAPAIATLVRLLAESGNALAGNTDAIRRTAYQPRHRR